MDKLVKESMSEKEMLEVATFFLEKNQQNRLDYTEKYEALIEEISSLDIQKTPEDSSYLNEQEELKERLRKELKDFRREWAKQEKMKPYFLFNDAQMEDLIVKRPKNKEELCQVSGFGKVKAEKYGEKILQVLNKGE